MSWGISDDRYGSLSDSGARGGIDSSRAREQMKMLHTLVARGAKWLPSDKRSIGDTRQYLIKMAPAYILEFAWLMQTYSAARRRDVQELLRTPAIARVVWHERERVASIVASIPKEPPSAQPA